MSKRPQQSGDPTKFGSTRFQPGAQPSDGQAAPAQVIIVQGREAGRVVGIDRSEFSIGRHPENALVLDSQMVSRRHACVLHEGTRYEIEDLGSRNGVLLNGRKLASGSRHALRHKDVLQLSDCRLLFLCTEDSGEIDRLATIHLDQSRIGQEVDELLRNYLPPAREGSS